MTTTFYQELLRISTAVQLDNWRDSPMGSKGSSLGMASRASSSDLDKMHGIPLLLRSRASGAGMSSLPELGALLGRGSFGKVYKGAALVDAFPGLC